MSTIDNFDDDAIILQPGAEFATNLGTQNKWSVKADNVYQRTVTVDNTGKTLKINHPFRILLDTRALVVAGKMGPACNDIRVYDSDGTTLLVYEVIAPNTPWTVIVAWKTLEANTSHTVYVEYGNPTLADAQDLTFSKKNPGVFNFSALEIKNEVAGGAENTDPIEVIINADNNKMWRLWNKTTTQQPQFRYNVTDNLNGLPVLNFSGDVLRSSASWHEFNQLDLINQFSIYALVYADTNKQNFQSVVQFQDASSSGNPYVLPFWSGGVSTRCNFIISTDGGSASGLDTGVVAGAWNFVSMHYTVNTTNGMKTYRNGSLVAQRNSGATSLASGMDMAIGSRIAVAGEEFAGKIAMLAVSIADESAFGRTDVEKYWNAVYRWNATDQPTITLGSETPITNEFTYIDYSPFATLNVSENGENLGTITSHVSDLTLQRTLEATLAVGNDIEAWNNSTEDTSQKIPGGYGRRISASTTPVTDFVPISRNEYAGPNLITNPRFTDWTGDNPDGWTVSTESAGVEITQGNFGARLVTSGANIQMSQGILTSTRQYKARIYVTEISGTSGGIEICHPTNVTAILSVTTPGWHEVTFTASSANIFVKRKIGGTTDAMMREFVVYEIQNINALNEFYYDNPIVNTTYTSETRDYVTFFLSAADVSLINTTNTVVRMKEAGGDYFQAPLSANINSLTDNIPNYVQIAKSSFSSAVGTPAWSDVVTFEIVVELSSSSQDVYYGYVTHLKNYDGDPIFGLGNRVRAKALVSSDLGTSYYSHTVLDGVISSIKMEGDNVALGLQSYLEAVKDLNFSDLPAMPPRYILWDISREEADGNITSKELNYYTFCMERILGMIFPTSYLDIDLDMDAGDDDVGGVAATVPQTDYFFIRSTDKVGEKIEAILKACGGYITYDAENAKIIARNGYKTWDDATGLLPTATDIDIVIPPYSTDTSTEANIYNYMEITAVEATKITNLGPHVGFSTSQGIRIPVTGSSVDGATIVLPAVAPNRIASIFFDTFYADGWAISDSQDSTTPVATTGVSLVNVELTDFAVTQLPSGEYYAGPALLLNFRNVFGSDKFLIAFGAGGNSVQWDYVTNHNSTNRSRFTTTVNNTISQRNSGKQEYEIDLLYQYVKLDNTVSSSNLVQAPALYTQLVAQFGSGSVIKFETVFNPYLYCGKVINVRDKNGKQTKAYIIDIQTYLSATYHTQKITARIIDN